MMAVSDYDHSMQRVIDAEKRLEKANGKLVELRQQLEAAIEVLASPMESGVSDPTGIMGESRITQAKYVIDAHKWVQISDIDAALREFQAAKTAVRGAKEALPAEVAARLK